MRMSFLVCAILMFSASGYAACPTADLSGDCYVGLADLAVLAIQWDSEPNAAAFSVMASQWMTEGVPDDPENLVWVSINDSGAGMEDGSGNPISHGGFTGEMSKYETTNAQYCQFLNEALASRDITVGVIYENRVYGSNGANSGADFVGEVYFDTYEISSYSQITYSAGTFSLRSRDANDMGNHPVAMVSWYGATAFCNYYGFRLPTEWEWQAVADYHGIYTYGCGATIDFSKANYYDGGHANPLGLTDTPYTSPVDHYLSYGYGMNDMAGNVGELTSTVNSGGRAILRGGSWNSRDFRSTVSYAAAISLRSTYNGVGFRVCR